MKKSSQSRTLVIWRLAIFSLVFSLTCFFLYQIQKIHLFFSFSTPEPLVHVLVLLSLDYCNIFCLSYLLESQLPFSGQRNGHAKKAPFPLPCRTHCLSVCIAPSVPFGLEVPCPCMHDLIQPSLYSPADVSNPVFTFSPVPCVSVNCIVPFISQQYFSGTSSNTTPF